jgi:NADH dehydrogenase
MTEALRDVAVLYNTYWVRFNHADFSHTKAVRNTLVLFEAAKAAGVERIVHISITNAAPASPLEYLSAKGQLEKALKSFGLSNAVVRPAVLFGPEDILINNTAWALRRFPVFCLFGDGSYHVRPIHVDDLAAIMVEQGLHRENTLINALGPEDFTWRELVTMLADVLAQTSGRRPRLLELSPEMGLRLAWLMGKLVGDVVVTREEIAGLMADLLHVPGAAPTGSTRLSDWARANRDTLGAVYHSELDRRNIRGRTLRA